MKTKAISLFSIITLFFSCQKDKKIEITTDQYHASVDNVTQIMLHDIFAPPVASRIYVYPNIAAYEVIAQNSSKFTSLQKQLNGLDSIPKLNPKLGVNKNLAALVAHMEVSKQLIFSEKTVETFRDSLYNIWSDCNQKEFEVSRDYGLKVAERIKNWMGKDNYKQTRTFPKYTVQPNKPERWQPTPPAYMDAVEPHWGKIRPMVLDTSSQFRPEMPFAYSTDKNSPFFKQVQQVYEVSKMMVANGDNSEEMKIAQFWDCNPYVTVTQGHMAFAKKKISPGAHWIGIVKIACKKTKVDFDTTVFAYTKASIGIFEGFISCWEAKYITNVVRPETIINQNIDENWRPLLQTPPFPEYTSGHSVVSTCSSKLLTNIFGENFAFSDDTELQFGLPTRSYTSFDQAAKEAAMSRFYGGIHFMAAITNGSKQGAAIGDYLNIKLKMRN